MKIKADPAAIGISAVLFYLDREGIFPLFLAAAAIHESAHLIFAGRFSKSAELSIGTFASNIDLGLMAPRREAASLLAGPLANLIIGLILALSGRASVFAGLNLVLGAYNLLPVSCLDGGRLIRLMLEDCPAGLIVADIISILTTMAIILFGAYLQLENNSGIGIIALGVWQVFQLFSCNRLKNVIK